MAKKTEFSYGLFRKLFDNLHDFQELLDGGMEEKEWAEETDRSLRACTKLSIFPQLENIEHWGEEVNLIGYHETRDKGRVVGARGVVCSQMDYRDKDEPHFLYEFAHLENPGGKGGIEEYVREVHFDDIVTKVLAPLDTEIHSASPPRGSKNGRKLLEGFIKRSETSKAGFSAKEKKEIKYLCLVEGENFDVWKAGFHQGSYQLIVTADSFIGHPDEKWHIDTYLKGESMKERLKVPSLTEEQLAKTWLLNGRGQWYNIGVVDLDPVLTERKAEEGRMQTQKETAGRIYRSALEGKFEGISPEELQEAVSLYNPREMAILIAVVGTDTEEHKRQFGDSFLEVCRQHCPDKLEEAYKLLKQTTG